MKIKTKIIIIIAVFSVGLILSGSIFMSLFFFDMIDRQEKLDISNRCRNLASYVQDQADTLESTLNDWAKWDETYSFVSGANGEYAENYLTPDTIGNLNISFIAYYDGDRKEIRRLYCDGDGGGITELPSGLGEWIAGDIEAAFGSGRQYEDETTIALCGGKSYLYARTAVTDTARTMEPAGVMAVGRKFDGDMLKKMGNLADGEAALLARGSLDASILSALDRQPETGGIRALSVAEDNATMRTYIKLDLNGAFTGTILEMTERRDIFQSGLQQHNMMLITFLALTVLILLVLLRTLDVFISKPMVSLVRSIGFIKSSENPPHRLEVKGKGELAVLSATINGMLDNIEENCREIGKKETERRLAEEEREYARYHDRLTGLYNRRYFEEALHRLDAPESYPLSVVIGDLNGLKFTNDAFGHETGDRLLVAVAGILRQCCRKEDIIARWGGDEFTLLLPRTSADDVSAVCARIRDNVAKLVINSTSYTMTLGHETKTGSDEDIDALLKRAEDFMYRRKMTENLTGRGNAIHTILTTFQEKNEREREHSSRVSRLCRRIAEAMGFSEEQAADMEIAGLMHDIGKIAIRDTVINKKGMLSEDEWAEMKEHPEIGCRILCASNEMLEIAGYILAHHERWDGSGYPKGLEGREIPLQARIIAVADAYDAITSLRPYKKKLDEADAVAELKRCSGLQFDPAVVRAFVEGVLGYRWDECGSGKRRNAWERAGDAI